MFTRINKTTKFWYSFSISYSIMQIFELNFGITIAIFSCVVMQEYIDFLAVTILVKFVMLALSLEAS